MKRMKRTTEDERRERVTEYRSSGKSIKSWCKEQEISYTTFLSWLKQNPRSNEEEPVQPIEWVEVVSTSKVPADREEQKQSQTSKIRLLLNGIEIIVDEGFTPEHLANVLSVVSRVCC